MTHPTREEWMAYLYEEMPADEGAELRLHLESCAECRGQVTVWQRATAQMSEWKLARKRRRSSRATLARWAVAAAVAALAVAGAVRLVFLQNEVKELRAEMRGPFRQEMEAAMQREMGERLRHDFDAALAQVTDQASRSASAEARALVAAVAQKWEEKRLADERAALTALQQIEAQRVTDYASLRQELETVAVLTEAGLQRAQNQIVNLASSTPIPDNNNK